ncbi:MAG: type II secretion system protein [Candidatus Pacebacteria bacterium]|nr:type II secretion system protein [Candidatus Paceibacterota bacterium]
MNKQQSFTLIELLVVIAIVGILAAIIVVSMGGAQDSARDAIRKTDVNQISKAVMIYRTNNPEVALPEETCTIGVDCSAMAIAVLGNASALTDPSSAKHYTFSSDGNDFIITSKLSDSTDYCFRSSTGQYTTNNCTSYASGPACPTGWIEMPGTSNCVMKYEAKIQGNDDGNQTYDSSFVAESRASGTPWVNINQQQANDECSAIGAHLMTNAEWVAIARNIESNSSPNTVSGAFYLGNTDAVQPVLEASTNDNDGYYGTGDSASSNPFRFSLVESAHAIAATCADSRDPVMQKRTFTLTNGAVIWDFSGNVSEWNSDTIEQADKPEGPSQWGMDFTAITNWKSLNSANFLPTNTSLSTYPNRIGGLYNGMDTTETIGYIRSGSIYGCESDAGIYYLRFDIPSTQNGILGSDLGFRCVKPKS